MPVGVQLLDGVGAGIFGALFPLVVQDVTHGTGRFNVSLGAITAASGIAAAVSSLVAGLALYLCAMPGNSRHGAPIGKEVTNTTVLV